MEYNWKTFPPSVFANAPTENQFQLRARRLEFRQGIRKTQNSRISKANSTGLYDWSFFERVSEYSGAEWVPQPVVGFGGEFIVRQLRRIAAVSPESARQQNEVQSVVPPYDPETHRRSRGSDAAPGDLVGRLMNTTDRVFAFFLNPTRLAYMARNLHPYSSDRWLGIRV